MYGRILMLISQQQTQRRTALESWSLRAWQWLNDTLWGGRLPHDPTIVWHPVAGVFGCSARSIRPDVILLHPGLLDSGVPLKDVPREHAAPRLAMDALIHASMHAAQECLLKGIPETHSPHACQTWDEAVRHIAPRPGLEAIVPGGSDATRLPISEGPVGPRGRRPTRVKRMTATGLPYSVIAGFPRAARLWLGQGDYYLSNDLPFDRRR
jgi:hypothetical protein